MNIQRYNYLETIYNSLSREARDVLPLNDFETIALETNDVDLSERLTKLVNTTLARLQLQNGNGNTKRYRFNQANARDKLLNILFENAFAQNPNRIVRGAEQAEDVPTVFYPKWKEVVWVKVPKNLGKVCKNPIFKVAVTVISVFVAYKNLKLAYNSTVNFTTGKLLPFVINNTPIQVMRAGNSVANGFMKVRGAVKNNRFTLLFYALVIKGVAHVLSKKLNALPENRRNLIEAKILTKTTNFIKKIPLDLVFFILFPSTISATWFCVERSFRAGVSVWKMTDGLANHLQTLSVNNEHYRKELIRSKAYDVWMRVTHEQVPAAA